MRVRSTIGDAIVVGVGTAGFPYVVDAIVVTVEVETVDDAIAVGITSDSGGATSRFFHGVEDSVVVVVQVDAIRFAIAIGVGRSLHGNIDRIGHDGFRHKARAIGWDNDCKVWHHIIAI